ncbi:polyprenyl synthetase family protein [Streptomyces longwoodensis]|uniref:polyprenyl synthetase family protein n=1 Tax=Streptomyces longwoodensis TaxID=68231 RepID=UPI00384EA364
MRFTQATVRHTARPDEPPGAGATSQQAREPAHPSPRYSAPTGAGGPFGGPGLLDGLLSDDPAAVDTDVAGAVGATLARLLATRVDDARVLDPLFARDVAERVADFTLRGGRRLRPRLLWWSLRACGGGDRAQVRAALRAAAALELLQTCALVHDDVMDAAATRRGRPALHTAVAAQYGDGAPATARRLGESAAVLAGDLALAWADDTVAELLADGADLPPGAARRAHEVWRTTRTEMVAGQYLDVQGQATAQHTVARAVRAACLKSALYTVERPVELGAVLAGAEASVARALCRAGRCAGLAFQLRDDLDDLFADPGVTGKPSGGDVREGKPTYLMALTRARAAGTGDRHALEVLDAAVGRADLTGAGLDRVREVVVATGARDAVETRIARLSRRALRHVAVAELPQPRAAAALRELLTEISGPRDGTAAPGHRPAPAPTSTPAPPTGAAPAGSLPVAVPEVAR